MAYLASIIAALLYGLYNALLIKGVQVVPASLLVAIAQSVSAVLAWSVVASSGGLSHLSTLGRGDFLFVASFGLMAYLADFLWTKAFALGGNFMFINGMIACVAIFSAMFGAYIYGLRPNLLQVSGVLLCVIGAYMIYVARG